MKTLKNLFYFPLVALILVGCETDELPILSTSAITEVSSTTAICGGSVTSDGGAPITERGVCWNTTGNPTIADNKTSDTIGVGSFISEIAGLKSNTTYYVRAYATNAVGTAYGEEVSFKTEVQIIEINNVKIEREFSTSVIFDNGNPGTTRFSISGKLLLNEIEEIKQYIDSLKEININSISIDLEKDFYGTASSSIVIKSVDLSLDSFTEIIYYNNVYWGLSFSEDIMKKIGDAFLKSKELDINLDGEAEYHPVEHTFGSMRAKLVIYADFKAVVKN